MRNNRVFTSPEQAGLPSDKQVTQALRQIVIDRDPDRFWPEHRYGVAGDGNFDAEDMVTPSRAEIARFMGTAGQVDRPELT